MQLNRLTPSSRHLRATFALGLGLVACKEPAGGADASTDGTGETMTDSAGETTTPTGGPDEDDAVFFLPARAGDEAFILQISPATGAVAPFGPALPAPADDITYQEIRATPDGARVAVRCWIEPETPVATLLVGDGSSWKLVTKYNKSGLGGSELSPDASLMWFDEISFVDDTPNYQARVIDMQGAEVFAGTPQPPETSLGIGAFAPDGSWFSFRNFDGEQTLHTLAGATAELPSGYVLVAFPDSLIFSAGEVPLRWLDLASQPLTVPGFVPDLASVSPLGYQVADGQLSLLGDGTVTPLQQVPQAMWATRVYTHRAGAFAVGKLGDPGSLVTVGPGGAVVSEFDLPPDPTPPDGGELETTIFMRASCVECPTPMLVVEARQFITSGDTGFDGDTSTYLWRLDASGKTVQTDTLRPWQDSAGADAFTFSADGAFLMWAEAGQLLRRDVQSETTETLEIPFEISKP